MKKGIVTILALAIIGALGIYSKDHKTARVSANPTSTNTSTLGSTAASSADTTGTTVQTSGINYKDGTFTGASEQTEYGTVQVAAVVSSGKIINIQFLQMPGPEGRSKEITAFAESPLKQSAISKQSANIDFVSGATTTSEAYSQSLQAALNQAV